MKKNSLLTLLVLLSCTVFSQKLNLPPQTSFHKTAISDNGKYLASLGAENRLEIISLESEKVICEDKLQDIDVYVLSMGLSYSGKYLVVASVNEPLCVAKPFAEAPMLSFTFYEVNVKKGLVYKQYYEIPVLYGDPDYAVSTPYEWTSNLNDDFFLSVPYQRGVGVLYQTKFEKTDDESVYTPSYVLGTFHESSDFEDLYSAPELDATTIYFDVEEETDEVLVLTTKKDEKFEKELEKKGHDMTESTSYGILKTDLLKGKVSKKGSYQAYIAEGIDAENSKMISSWYSTMEGEGMSYLNYDSQQNRIYGIVVDNLFLRHIVGLEWQKENPKLTQDEFDEAFAQLFNWSSFDGNVAYPFYVDLNDNSFHSVISKEKLKIAKTDPAFFMMDAQLIDFHFDPTFENLYAYGVEKGKHYLYKYTREDGSMTQLELSIKKSDKYFNTRFTEDDKAICKLRYLDEESQITKLQIIYVDLKEMKVKRDANFESESHFTESFYLFFDETNGRNECLIDNGERRKEADSLLVKIDFKQLPFVSFTDKNEYQSYMDAFGYADRKAQMDQKTGNPWRMLELESFTEALNEHSYEQYYPYDCRDDQQEASGIMFDGDEGDFIISSSEYDGENLPEKYYVNHTLFTHEFRWKENTQELFVQGREMIDLYSKESNKIEHVFTTEERRIEGFDISRSGDLMAAVTFPHEGVYFWNTQSRELVAKLYLFNEGKDWVFVLPSNYYYGTKDAVAEIGFSFGDKSLPADFIDLKYNRPDIVLTAMGFEDEEVIKAFKSAYDKRLQKLGVSEEILKLESDIPYLKIENLEKIPAKTDQGSIKLDLKMYDIEKPIDQLNIWNNGVAVYGRSGISLSEQKSKTIDRTIEIPLAKGENQIEISVRNASGAESLKQSVSIYQEHSIAKSNLYLISVGVNEYADNRYNLSYAAKDAADIVSLFKGNSEQYENVYTLDFIDEQVQLDSLDSIRAFLEQATINDQVVLFIAGHGMLDESFDYYYASHNMDFSNPSKNGIPYEFWESILDGIKPQKKILLMDTCHSGEVDKDEVVVDDNTTQAEEGDLVFRSVGPSVQNKGGELGLQNTSELMKTLFTDLRKGTGATVISSAGGLEFAMESENWSNGLFTHCLINGIKNQKADLNGDAEIWLSELQEFVSAEVNHLSNGLQKPTSRIENQSLDFRLW